jgi:hypothetical protein
LEPGIENADPHILGIVRTGRHDIDDQAVQRAHLVDAQLMELALHGIALVQRNHHQRRRRQQADAHTRQDHESLAQPEIVKAPHPFQVMPEIAQRSLTHALEVAKKTP